MAYYRDQRGQPRSVRELVQRVGRSIVPTTNNHRIPSTRPQAINSSDRESQTVQTQGLRSSALEEEMGSRFPQCRRSQQPITAGRAAACNTRMRYAPYNRGPKPRPTAGRGFTRTVFLLNHDEDVIPRGPARQAMYEEGRVVDFVELHTSMSEDAVCKTLEDVFSNILPTQSLANPRFEYVKPCYGKVVVPNVTNRHSWNGERVKALTQQGHDLYIRSVGPLQMQFTDQESRSNDRDDNTVDNESYAQEREWRQDGTEAGCSSSLPCTSVVQGPVQRPSSSKQFKLSEQLHSLREMFPQVELSRIEEVIMIYGVEDGVGVLLEEAAEEETSPGQSTLDLPNQSSLQTILFEHAHQTMDHSREMYLKIKKNTLWQQSYIIAKERM